MHHVGLHWQLSPRKIDVRVYELYMTVRLFAVNTVDTATSQLDTRSTRHTVISSHGQLVTQSTRHKRMSHGHLVTRLTRHKGTTAVTYWSNDSAATLLFWNSQDCAKKFPSWPSNSEGNKQRKNNLTTIIVPEVIIIIVSVKVHEHSRIYRKHAFFTEGHFHWISYGQTPTDTRKPSCQTRCHLAFMAASHVTSSVTLCDAIVHMTLLFCTRCPHTCPAISNSGGHVPPWCRRLFPIRPPLPPN